MSSPSVGDSHSANWKVAFQSALIELDPAILPKRIEAARAAVQSRLRELAAAPLSDETMQLLDALNTLDDLVRMQSGNSA